MLFSLRNHFYVTKSQKDQFLGVKLNNQFKLKETRAIIRQKVSPAYIFTFAFCYVRLMISEIQYPVTCVEQPASARSVEVTDRNK